MYVVERHGEAVAAVVPIEFHDQWKRASEELFARMRGTSERADLSEVECLRLANDTVHAVGRESLAVR